MGVLRYMESQENAKVNGAHFVTCLSYSVVLRRDVVEMQGIHKICGWVVYMVPI